MAGSQTKVRGYGPGAGQVPAPMENTWVNTDGIAKSLVNELQARLAEIESIGALVAAAHLEAAIDALCREFGIERDASNTD